MTEKRHNMQVLSKDQKTYFEDHADDFLKERGISKAQFAKAMGVIPQNINKLVGTKNICTLTSIANYLDIPLPVILFGKDETKQDIHGCIYIGGKPNLVNSREDIENLLKEIE